MVVGSLLEFRWGCLSSYLVSPYQPDSPFSMSALSRLEDAGFEILTSLANIRQKFLEAAGVTLDQKARTEYEISEAGECVEIVIRQWLCGNSSLPPTWRALFGVLNQLNLEELSCDTQAYLSSELLYHIISRLKVYDSKLLYCSRTISESVD